MCLYSGEYHCSFNHCILCWFTCHHVRATSNTNSRILSHRYAQYTIDLHGQECSLLLYLLCSLLGLHRFTNFSLFSPVAPCCQFYYVDYCSNRLFHHFTFFGKNPSKDEKSMCSKIVKFVDTYASISFILVALCSLFV